MQPAVGAATAPARARTPSGSVPHRQRQAPMDYGGAASARRAGVFLQRFVAVEAQQVNPRRGRHDATVVSAMRARARGFAHAELRACVVAPSRRSMRISTPAAVFFRKRAGSTRVSLNTTRSPGAAVPAGRARRSCAGAARRTAPAAARGALRQGLLRDPSGRSKEVGFLQAFFQARRRR